MICIISELGEMMRQCQEGQVLALHLRHQDYAKAVKRNLKEELATHICDLLWRISAELLQMQINIRKPFSPAELAAGARIANSAGRRFRHRKLKKMCASRPPPKAPDVEAARQRRPCSARSTPTGGAAHLSRPLPQLLAPRRKTDNTLRPPRVSSCAGGASH